MVEEEGNCSNPRKKMITEPLLSSQKGGFRTLPFIIANEAFERVASSGLSPNMILYLTRDYGLRSSTAANAIFFWSAATDFFPMIGAFLADSYIGRYSTIAFGCIASLMGMVLLWATTIFPQARPLNLGLGHKAAPSLAQLTLLFSSFALMSVGAGGIRSSSMAFGADQLIESSGLDSFFQSYYVASLTSIIVAVTGIVYIQEHLGWMVGFGVPVALMLTSAVCFFSASRYYVKEKVKSSLITRFAQVLVASYANRGIDLPLAPAVGSFYCRKGSMVREPSPKLRFLNKACYIPPEQTHLLRTESNPRNPWKLCTIDQVEELKSLIDILPLWSTGIVVAIACFQTSFLVLQASAMDRHITRGFEIPAGSFTLFTIVSILLLFPLYTKAIIPLLSRLAGKPYQLTLMQRMGIGLVLSIVATFAVATAEFYRRERALVGDPPVSAMWLVPYFVLVGFSQGFNVVAQNEFYYTQLPKSMSSVATSLYGLGTSVGSLGSSVLVSGIDFGTRVGGKKGSSWVSSDLNKGHYDYYYWVIFCLGLVNLGYFVACCRAYEPIINIGEEGQGEGDGEEDQTIDV